MELQTKENSIQELKNENVEKEERILTKKDVTKSWWLWWLSVEVSNSFERLQALACCISMIPILRKLYKNEDDFRAGLKRHLQFFNTESTWGAITLGVAVAMEEQKAMGKQIPDEAINSVKTGLMGPFAGIGDTINWATFLPILLGFFIPVAESGNWIAGIAPLFIFAGVTCFVGYNTYHFGYNLGAKSATKLLNSGWLNKMITAAGVLGMFMMGGLAAGFVSVSTPLVIDTGSAVFNLQTDVFDSIVPGLLPFLTVAGVYVMLDKIKRNYTLAVFIILAVSLILGGLGIIVGIFMQFFASPVVALFTDASDASGAEVVRLGGQYLRGYVWDCMFAGIHFSFSGYFCACGKSGISFLHNIIAITLVRIPGVYLTSTLFPDTLFPMGLATAAGSLLSAIICVVAFTILNRKEKS